MAKNKQSNLIASVKMLNIGVIKKYTINLKIGGLSSISSSIPIILLKSLFISPLPPSVILLYKLYTKYCRNYRITVDYTVDRQNTIE